MFFLEKPYKESEFVPKVACGTPFDS